MDIAVIILNYNSFDDCNKCISFLKKQIGLSLELIIVDNCSSDRDKLISLCKEKNCTFIASDKNKGYNAGNNIGLRYAFEKGYKYALLVNPDMEFPQEDYIIKLMKKMEEDPNIVVVGSDIIDTNNVHQSPLKRHSNCYNNFSWVKSFFNKDFSSVYNIDNYIQSHYCWEVSGCCFLMRLEFIHAIDYFDENVFLYCEESILAEQIHKNKKETYYLAEAQAIHHHIDSKKGNPIRRLKQLKQSGIYFIRNYSDSNLLRQALAIFSLYVYIIMLSFVKIVRQIFNKD